MKKRYTPKYKKPTNFERGYIIAVANLIALHDEPGVGSELLQEEGLRIFDGRKFSEFDQDQFRKLNKEPLVDIKVVDKH